MTRARTTGWAIEWRSVSRLDGDKRHLMGGASINRPPEFGGYTTMVFATRDAARDHIREHYAYLKDRPDLRREPHGWRMPRAVRVTVTVAS